ncbi:MAG: hypothetical protein H0W21_02740 [Actinobacteria bacterium]|nr:hypothetical protein [Actinomycetota bacterium]
MTDEVLATAAAVALASIAGVCTSCYMILRRFRRSLLVANVRLAKQRFLSRSSPRRELAGMRASVLQVTHGTRSIMQMTREQDPSGELRRLHERLERLAATVGRQLEVLSYEPDDRVLEAALGEMRQRAERVIRVASEVRAAASLLSDCSVDYELAALSDEVRREVAALTYGRELVGRRSATSI